MRGEGEEGGGREVGEREVRHVHAFKHRQHVLPPAHRLDRHAAVMVTRRGGEGRLVQNKDDVIRGEEKCVHRQQEEKRRPSQHPSE